MQVGSILITADGFVRNVNLGTATRVTPDARPLNWKEATGIEPREFRVHEKANEALLRSLAEAAQSLPLEKIRQ